MNSAIPDVVASLFIPTESSPIATLESFPYCTVPIPYDLHYHAEAPTVFILADNISPYPASDYAVLSDFLTSFGTIDVNTATMLSKRTPNPSSEGFRSIQTSSTPALRFPLWFLPLLDRLRQVDFVRQRWIECLDGIRQLDSQNKSLTSVLPRLRETLASLPLNSFISGLMLFHCPDHPYRRLQSLALACWLGRTWLTDENIDSIAWLLNSVAQARSHSSRILHLAQFNWLHHQRKPPLGTGTTQPSLPPG